MERMSAAGWQHVANLISIRAYQHAQRGATSAAFADGVKIVRFGHRVQQAGGSLIHWNTGSVIKRMGAATLHQLSLTQALNQRVWATVVRELGQLRSHRKGLRPALEFAQDHAARQLDSLAEGRLSAEEIWLYEEGQLPENWRTAHLQVDATKELMAKVYQLTQDALNTRFDADGLRARLAKIVGRGDEPPLKGNAVGVRFVRNTTIEGFAHLLAVPCHEDVYLSSVRMVMTLQVYRAQKKRLPSQLASLHCSWFPATPTDPFDGQPMRYDAEKGIVYSAGTDRVDSGGSDPKDRRTGPPGPRRANLLDRLLVG